MQDSYHPMTSLTSPTTGSVPSREDRQASADARVKDGPNNPGMPLDLDWVRSVRVNRSAVERRAATLVTRRTVKKEWQAAWLLRAISVLDLTTLAGDDTPGTVRRLCAKGRRPLQQEVANALGIENLHVAAICVYHNLIPVAVEALRGSSIPVAAVSAGFPAGQISLADKLSQIRGSVDAGAAEIDIVISRAYVLDQQWRELYDEVKTLREACGSAHMKAIIATGELATLTNVGRASMVCMMAGADFIKTSTGKEATNATLPVGEVMVRAIREYRDRTAGVYRVGFKPAGGIRTAKDAIQWLILMKEELGTRWMMPDLFRIGASSLLTDIERQLSHYLTGHYAAEHHFALP
jgi:deoxyribose-phosphate aldolase